MAARPLVPCLVGLADLLVAVFTLASLTWRRELLGVLGLPVYLLLVRHGSVLRLDGCALLLVFPPCLQPRLTDPAAAQKLFFCLSFSEEEL